MKHKDSCASQGSIGGQGLEFIPCDCKGEYTEYKVTLKFTIGAMNLTDPIEAFKRVQEEVNIMFHKLEHELEVEHIWQQSLEVKPT